MDLLADDSLLDLRPHARRPAAASTPVPSTALPQPPPSTAPVGGTCALCNARLARTSCPSCGRAVCSIDLWAMLGLCKACAPPKPAGAAR